MKIEVESYTTEANVKVLTQSCPNGVGCKVGSMVCARCPKFQKRDSGFVYCSHGRKKKGGKR